MEYALLNKEETKISLTVTNAGIFWGYRFQQKVWGQKPLKTQKDIIAIFEEVFSVLNMYKCHG